MATNAELRNPASVALDTVGNVYIGDEGNNRIRKITASSGNISTLAGNGAAGYNGDGIAASAAELNSPEGVAVDGSGNVFIADNFNCRVRKVTASTGKISTVAGSGTNGYSGDGGLATSADLSAPSGVAVDTAGNLYIADFGNNRIRMVTASSGDISTAAGDGTAGYSGDGGVAASAELNGPYAVAVDAYGNIFVGDTSNNRLRAVGGPGVRILGHGLIDTVAGNGMGGFSGDGGPAIDASLYSPGGTVVDSAGNIYIADLLNMRVRKVTAPTGLISTVAGNGVGVYNGDGIPATQAGLWYPWAVAVDGVGNIYIADFQDQRIRKVTVSTGLISTVAGNGTPGYSGDGGAATSAELYGPIGVAVDGAGNIYIADYYNNRIRKVTASTGKISTVAGNGTAGYSGDGGAATSAELNGANGLAVDGADNVYIADTSNNRIRKVTAATGKISTVAGNGTAGYNGDTILATAASLNSPGGVAIDSSGNIYIADDKNNRVREVTASTGKISTVAGNGTAGYSGDGGPATSAEVSPAEVALDSAGDIYITASARIRVVGH